MTRREEVEAKLSRVRRWLGEHEYAAALLTTQGGFSWATAGGEAWVALGDDLAVGAVLVTADRVLLVTNTIEQPRLLDEEVAELGLDIRARPWHAATGLGEIAHELAGTSRVATDAPALAGLVYDRGLCALRYTLLAPEVERYRRLAREAAQVVEGACRTLSPGVTEHDVAASIAEGCRRRAIVPITDLVAADDRIRRYRHPVPTERRVREIAMLALTGRRQGLHVSLTRLVAFRRPDEDLRHRHRVVSLVDATYIVGSRPGRTLDAVLEDGVRAYAKGGFAGEWERHHQGGLTGYAGREIFATPSSGHALEAGQCLAWNPSITGTKSEDTVLVTDHGFEILSSTEAWPTLEVEVAGQVIRRPDILQR